jgi:cell wall-associated NlpC family hydrolase
MHSAGARARRASRHRVATARRLLLACLLAAQAALTAPGARADVSGPGGPGVPSQAQIDASQQTVTNRRADIAALQARYQTATAALDQLQVHAEQAVEAYDASTVRLHTAELAAVHAAESYALAQQAYNAAQQQVGEFAAQSYRDDGALSGLAAVLAAHSAQQFLDTLTVVHQIASEQRSTYLTRRRDSTIAANLRTRAEDALAAQRRAEQTVAAASEAASAAVLGAQHQLAALSAQRQRYLSELAAAQRTTVRLEAERQQALAEQAAQQAAAAAAASAARQQQAQGGSGFAGSSAPLHYDARGARIAIAYAEAQLGKPYVWGGTGPTGFDCSGLTMRAWEAAGYDLPHFAASQYAVSHPLTLYQLMPGDLVFWATDPTDPDTIYHEAMYLGDGQIIEAPHTGEDVKIASLYINGTPDFYARP